MKAAVIVFPGSNCDRDLSIAFEKVTGTKTKLILEILPPFYSSLFEDLIFRENFQNFEN